MKLANGNLVIYKIFFFVLIGFYPMTALAHGSGSAYLTLWSYLAIVFCLLVYVIVFKPTLKQSIFSVIGTVLAVAVTWISLGTLVLTEDSYFKAIVEGVFVLSPWVGFLFGIYLGRKNHSKGANHDNSR